MRWKKGVKNMTANRKCPVCGGLDARLIKQVHNIVPKGFLLPYGTDADLLVCLSCGAVFHDVAETMDADAYYGSYTGNGETKEYEVKEDEKRLNLGCAKFLLNANIHKSDFILDVGCSYGVLLSILKEQGFHNLYGLDEDKSAVSYLEKKGYPMRCASIFEEGLPEFEHKFDVIVLRAILEHLYDPKRAIQNVERWLKPGGTLMLVVPDLSSYYELEPFPGYYVEFEHINHFTLESIMNLMNDWDLRAYEKASELYPIMRVIFSKKESPIKRKLCFDENGLIYFNRHLNQANREAKKLMDKIMCLKESQTEAALWGGGNFVYRLLTHTPLKDCNIKYVIDRNEALQGCELEGRIIMSPEDFAEEHFSGPIIISGKSSIKSIKANIKDLALKNPIICLSE